MNLPHADALRWIDAQTDALREELIRLARQNSGSFNADGVRAVAARVAEWFAPLGGESRLIEVPDFVDTDDTGRRRNRPLGPVLSIRKRPDAPLRVFLGGHLDTVYGVNHPFQEVDQPEDDTLHGPGVADLKGGLLVAWLALSALERDPARERIGWEVLFNPDEEIGSQSSAPLLAEAARRNHFGLVFEPSFPDGMLAGARKGSGNFDIVVHGRAAHAGRNPEAGRNAIAAAAELAGALQSLNGRRAGVTVNVGYVHGGGALNVVPDLCVLKFNVRTRLAEDEAWLQAQLESSLARIRARDGFRVETFGGFTRPPKPVDERTARLNGMIDDAGRALGLQLTFRDTGGCCDGNNLAAAGLPNVDNLGVVGADIHSEHERMRIGSLPERGKLSALLLLRLAGGELTWQ
ncbi:MAG: hydrolase [Gammaproteobacteria bacterium]|nr:hydrolase [Gammaproteobacteria bacterium]